MATPRNPMAPAVTSPFGNNGQNVVNPVPPEAIALQQAQDNAQVTQALDMNALNQNGLMTPEQAAMAPAQPVQQAPASLDDLFAQFDAEDAAQETSATAALPEQSLAQSGLEQIREAGARIRNAFTVTPRESVETLRGTGLFDDVRLGANGVEVIRKGRGAWEPFDRDKLELLGDTLDWTRDVFETAVEGGTEVAGTIAGALGGAGVGAIPANIAAGAAGAVVAKNFGDAVARNLLGIKTDPERSLPTESAVAGAIGAGFGWLGSTLARRNAERSAKALASEGSYARTMEQVADTMDDIDMVRNSGINIDGNGEFRVDLNMATGGQHQEALGQAKWLSDQDGYRNFVETQGENIQGAYDSLAGTVAGLAGKNKNLGEDFVLSAADIRKAEGRLIGDYRKLAREAGKVPQPATRTTEQVNNLITQFGGNVEVKPKAGTRGNWLTGESATAGKGVDVHIKLPSSQDIMRQYPGMTEGQANLLRGELGTLAGQLNSGQGKIRIDDLEVAYNRINKAIQNGMNSANGKSYAVALMDLRNSMRDDWVDGIGNVIPQSAKSDYVQSVRRYREIMQATDNLGRVLDSSDISKDALVKQMFESPKAWQNIKGAKTLIEETNPELWTNLAGEYFNRVIRTNTDEFGTTNYKAVSKQWSKLDPRVQEELAKTVGFTVEGIDALNRLGTKYQNSTFDYLMKESEQGAIKRTVKTAIAGWLGGGAAQATAAVNNMKGVGKDGALIRWLQADGNMSQIAKELGRSNRGFIQAFENAVYNWQPRVNQGSQFVTGRLPERLGQPIQSTVEAGTRAAAGTGPLLQTGFRREVENER